MIQTLREILRLIDGMRPSPAAALGAGRADASSR
jgi:hypothetical protein